MSDLSSLPVDELEKRLRGASGPLGEGERERLRVELTDRLTTQLVDKIAPPKRGLFGRRRKR